LSGAESRLEAKRFRREFREDDFRISAILLQEVAE